jgi:hypothetical protein
MSREKKMKAMRLYSALMEEVKLRLECVEAATKGRTNLASPFVRELCTLQFRYIFELIALGCFVAHGDIEADHPKKIKKLWTPNEILSHLESLHPDYYPLPVTIKREPERIFMEPSKDGFLTKQELIDLYGEAGNLLHKGNIKRLLKPRMPIETRFADVDALAHKVLALLARHTHHLFDGTTFICLLYVRESNWRCEVSLAEPADREEVAALLARIQEAKQKPPSQ